MSLLDSLLLVSLLLAARLLIPWAASISSIFLLKYCYYHQVSHQSRFKIKIV